MGEIYIRQKQTIIETPQYKNGIMQFFHATQFGRFLMKYIFSLPPISSIITRKKYRADSKCEILPFIEEFSLNSAEFEKEVDGFSCFAEFFVRKLKKEARPFVADNKVFTSPCDGALTLVNISAASSLTVKGCTFSLPDFLGGSSAAGQFADGTAAVIYLAPYDYHRFHYPVDCTLNKTEILGNRLFSVSPLSLEHGFRPFDVNVRHIHYLTHPHIGDFVMAEVGAFYVGKIVQTNTMAGAKRKGDEKGFFGLGGSTVVLLFRKDVIMFDRDLTEMSIKNIPAAVKAGEQIGEIR